MSAALQHGSASGDTHTKGQGSEQASGHKPLPSRTFPHTMSARKASEPMRKHILDKLSIYIPEMKIGQRPVERLRAFGKRRDRSVNYLVVEGDY